MTVARSRAGQGFTLLEMLVVVAIMALISGLAFPLLEKMRARQQFATDTNRLYLGIVEARAGALRQARPVDVARLDFRDGLESSGRATNVPGTTRVDLPAGGLRFYADGTSNGGSVRLTEGGRTAVFSIDRDIGAIRVAP